MFTWLGVLARQKNIFFVFIRQYLHLIQYFLLVLLPDLLREWIAFDVRGRNLKKLKKIYSKLKAFFAKVLATAWQIGFRTQDFKSQLNILDYSEVKFC